MTTDADGTFSTRLEPGTYDLAVSAFGFEDAKVSNVVVTQNSFTPVAVSLQNVPSGQLTGTVVYDESGSATIPVPDPATEPADATDAVSAKATINAKAKNAAPMNARTLRR